jgi:hypothetical protein
MSRLGQMSPQAVEALFALESSDTLVTLLTVYDPDTQEPVAHISDNFTHRISETEAEVIYGITSNGIDYTFLPVEISLPSEDRDGSSRFSLVISDVTHYLTPLIRTISGPPKVRLQLVLKSQPDVIEAEFKEFFITSITYNGNQVTCEMNLINYQVEPFPIYSFTPKYFPGLF